MTLLIFIIVLSISIIPLVLLRKFRSYCENFSERYISSENKKSFSSVIIPCKGTDFEFEKNLEALTQLDSEWFEVIFVTATDNDPARESIMKVIEKLRNRGLVVKLMTAGIKDTCAQKLYNLVQGVKGANPSSEFLIFIDADIRLEQEMLISLVQPLSDNSVGAATGFPVFIPSDRISSIVRFAWGLGGLLMLADKNKVFTHGAINAIRHQDFYTLQIEEKYLNSVSDSLTLASVIRKNKKEIVFVPNAIVPSPDNTNLIDLIKWSNRLTILSRIYNPNFWKMIFLNYASVSFLFIFLFLSLINNFSLENLFILLMYVFSYQLLQMYTFYINFNFIINLLPEKFRIELINLKWKILLYSPLALPLILLNLVVSLFSKTITWRQITYKIYSDKKVEIINGV